MQRSQRPTRILTLILYCHLTFLFLCLAACTPSDDAWNRVSETGTLRVGMDASFPPFESVSADGRLVGLDVDLARELGQRLGIEVQFISNLPYDGLYDALTAGSDRNRMGVDVVISALAVNSARMTDFAYSTSYFDAGQVLVVHEGESGIEEMADLGERTLAVEFGTRGDMEARRWTQKLTDFTVAPYQTASEALEAAAAGATDAALVDHVSALTAVGKLSGDPENPRELVIVGKPVVEEPYAVAMRKENQRLLRKINEALAGMEADGTLEMLIEQWICAQPITIKSEHKKRAKRMCSTSLVQNLAQE